MIRHYYYDEYLPTDFIEGMSEDEILHHAVTQIRERQKYYRIPAQWELMKIEEKNCLETKVRVRYSFNAKIECK